MRTVYALLCMSLAAVACADACASSGSAASVQRQRFVEPRSARAYTLFSRGAHDRKRPARVLFALHPYGGEPEELVERLELVTRAVEQRGWLLVVPEGGRAEYGLRRWNASAACCGRGAGPDDVGYLRAVLADVRKRFAVAARSVSAFGFSNGGFMAHRWACAPGGDVRVVVSIAGAAPGPDDPPCAPTVAVSVLQIHGDRDEVIRYQGGATRADALGRGARYPSAADSVATWLRVGPRGKEATAWPEVVESRPPGRALGAVRLRDFASGSRHVSLWTVEGGGHHLAELPALLPAIFAFMEAKLPR